MCIRDSCLIRELSKRGVEEFHFEDRSNGHGFVAFWVPGHPFKKDEDFEADVDGLRLAHMAWKLTRGSDYTHFKHFGRLSGGPTATYTIENDHLYPVLRYRKARIWMGTQFVSQQSFDDDGLITRLVTPNLSTCLKLVRGSARSPQLVLGDGTVRNINHANRWGAPSIKAWRPGDVDNFGRPVYRIYEFVTVAHTSRLPTLNHRQKPTQTALTRTQASYLEDISNELLTEALSMLKDRGWKLSNWVGGDYSSCATAAGVQLERVHLYGHYSHGASICSDDDSDFTGFVCHTSHAPEGCVAHAVHRATRYVLGYPHTDGLRRLIELKRYYATTHTGEEVELSEETELSQSEVTGVFAELKVINYITPAEDLTVRVPALWFITTYPQRRVKVWFDPETAKEYTNTELFKMAGNRIDVLGAEELVRYHKDDYVPDYPNKVYGGYQDRNAVLRREDI